MDTSTDEQPRNGFTLDGARAIRDMKGVSLQERAVLYDANVRANRLHQFCIRIDTWADALDVPERTLKLHVASLIKKGLLHRARRYGRANLYTVTLPSIGQPVAPSNGQPIAPSTGNPLPNIKTPLEDSSDKTEVQTTSEAPSTGLGTQDQEISEYPGEDQETYEIDPEEWKEVEAMVWFDIHGKQVTGKKIGKLVNGIVVPLDEHEKLLLRANELATNFAKAESGHARLKFYCDAARLLFPEWKDMHKPKPVGNLDLKQLDQFLFPVFGKRASYVLARAMYRWSIKRPPGATKRPQIDQLSGRHDELAGEWLKTFKQLDRYASEAHDDLYTRFGVNDKPVAIKHHQHEEHVA